MSLIKFSEYFNEAIQVPVLGEDSDDCVIVEWSEEEWLKLTVSERAELEAEAVNGWAMWQIGAMDDDKDGEPDEYSGMYEGEEEISMFLAMNEDDDTLDEYQARNTMQRRKTQKNKDRMKFKDRGAKLKAKIERKKGGVKVKRIKMRKKWMRKNKAKIKNAQKVFGGKVKSKFTKKR